MGKYDYLYLAINYINGLADLMEESLDLGDYCSYKMYLFSAKIMISYLDEVLN